MYVYQIIFEYFCLSVSLFVPTNLWKGWTGFNGTGRQLIKRNFFRLGLPVAVPAVIIVP